MHLRAGEDWGKEKQPCQEKPWLQTAWSPSHTAEQVNLPQVPPPQGTNYFTPRGVKIHSSDNEGLNLSGLTTSYSS